LLSGKRESLNKSFSDVGHNKFPSTLREILMVVAMVMVVMLMVVVVLVVVVLVVVGD
jgi:hypothetical protein